MTTTARKPRKPAIEKRDYGFIRPEQWGDGEVIPLPRHIARAIKCGKLEKVVFRNWRPLPFDQLTKAEKAMRFLETVCKVPGGSHTGKDLRLMFFQEVILILLLTLMPKQSVISLSRRNGKTFLLSCVALIFQVTELALLNDTLCSAALSRDQSSILFKQLSDMIALSPALHDRTKVIPSQKTVIGLGRNVTYSAISSEAKSGLGRSYRLVVHDEIGSILGPDDEFTSMLRTSQGSYHNSIYVGISTQSASDADYMSQLIDASIRDQPEDVLTIVFETPEEYDIDDEEGWIYSNPGLDVFRSRDDLRSQAESAKRIPAQASRFSNLCLNRRTSADSVWLAPSIYKANGGPVDMNVFRENGCVVGLDLSRVNDLCCAAIAAKDPESGLIHLKVYTFSPADGLEERSRRDRVPYDVWRDQGHIYSPPGRTLDYDMVAGWLAQELEREGIVVNQVCFDRWGAAAFFAACDRVGFAVNAIREEVGQGYVSISPRIQAMETALLQEKIRHGNDQPVLALGASSAIVVQDHQLNRKLDKTKASNKIDALMASLFAVYPLISGTEEEPVDMSWSLTLEPDNYQGGFSPWR